MKIRLSAFFIGLLLLLVASCQSEDKVVYILFDDSEGLSVGQDVLLNGVSVGKVLDVDINEEYAVITRVELSESVDFPKGSLFEIQSQDIFTKIIHVTLSESEQMIETGDTLQGILTINLIEQVSCGSKTPTIIDDVKEMLKN